MRLARSAAVSLSSASGTGALISGFGVTGAACGAALAALRDGGSGTLLRRTSTCTVLARPPDLPPRAAAGSTEPPRDSVPLPDKLSVFGFFVSSLIYPVPFRLVQLYHIAGFFLITVPVLFINTIQLARFRLTQPHIQGL